MRTELLSEFTVSENRCAVFFLRLEHYCIYLAREDESIGHTEYVLKLRGNYMNDVIMSAMLLHCAYN